MPNWKIIIPSFFVILFLLRYYEFFYIYRPVQPFDTGIEPTLATFTLYNYLLKVIFYGFKFLTISVILSAGIFLEGSKNKTEQASLKDLFLLTVLCEFVFFGQDLLKIANFSFINSVYTYEDYKTFFPLSLYDLLGTYPESNFAYAFQTLNLFEVLYVSFLILGLRKLQYPENMKAVSVTLSSYGGALFIWGLIMTFYSIL